MIPDWDEKSLHTVRDAVNVLAATKTDTSGFFGDKAKLNPIDHLLGTAYGWGGNPKASAVYSGVVPEKNDGVVPYVLTVRNVPVEASGRSPFTTRRVSWSAMTGTPTR